jgi:hypothetical protein
MSDLIFSTKSGFHFFNFEFEELQPGSPPPPFFVAHLFVTTACVCLTNFEAISISREIA